MSDGDFRWQAFFQRSTTPTFVLNRQLYLLHANEAFERLVGLSAEELKRISCSSSAPPKPDEPWDRTLAHLLSPPDEVRAGRAGRQRRLVPGRGGQPARWWDIDYLPLSDDDGFRGLIGTIVPGPEAVRPVSPPLPEKVVNLRRLVFDGLSQVYLGSRIPPLRRLADQIRAAAQTRAAVAVVGGPGSGRRTAARLIHYRGPNREKALACLDCRRLPGFAVGAMLWGESGAAARAALGTVYLHEPAELPRELQERLLHWLGTLTSDNLMRPRLLTGWNADPVEALDAGKLLEELYHALTPLRLDVPSLKDRHDDLPHLVDRLLLRLSARTGRRIETLTPDAWEIVLGYAWPGNIAELFDALNSAANGLEGDRIDARDLPAYLRRADAVGLTPVARPAATMPIKPLMQQVERRLIELALRRTRDNRRRAARLLDVNVPWLYKRLHELGLIDEEPEVEPEAEE